MRILFGPVGDTDPIRGYRDGAVLHIIRHYKIDKAVLFLTSEMVSREEKEQIYTKAISFKGNAPACEIELIKKREISEPHHYESLLPLIYAFEELLKKHAQDEIYLNLSSGTPQMKNIMAFLAAENPQVHPIQVLSPLKGSNRNNHPQENETDIDAAIETNEDMLYDMENRCEIAQLRLIKNYFVRRQIAELIDNYQYAGALALYKKNKDIFPSATGEWLEYARLREALMLKEADDKLGPATKEALKPEEKGLLCYHKAANKKAKCVREIYEFLMVMEIKQKQKQLADFLLKLTPFLYKVSLFYLEEVIGIKKKEICSHDSRFSVSITQKIRPDLVAAINKLPFYQARGAIKDANLSSKIILEILQVLEPSTLKANAQLIKQMENLREVEEKLRNLQAHEIAPVTEAEIKGATTYQDSAAILHSLKDVFQQVIEAAGVSHEARKNIYTLINEKIKESLKL